MPISKHPEQGWRSSACCFCSDICLPLQVEDPHVWPHGRSRYQAEPTFGRAHACRSDGMMESVPVPGGAGRTGQGCRAPARPQRHGFASAPLLSTLDATGQQVRAASGAGGQQAGEEPQAALQMCETRAWQHSGRGRSQTCESQPERARHNRSAVRQPPVALEARLALIVSSFYQSNREQSYCFFFPVCLTLVLGSCFM